MKNCVVENEHVEILNGELTFPLKFIFENAYVTAPRRKKRRGFPLLRPPPSL